MEYMFCFYSASATVKDCLHYATRLHMQRETRLLATALRSVTMKLQAAATHETAACSGLLDREGSISCNMLNVPGDIDNKALDNIPQRITKASLDEIPTMDEMARAIAGLKHLGEMEFM